MSWQTTDFPIQSDWRAHTHLSELCNVCIFYLKTLWAGKYSQDPVLRPTSWKEVKVFTAMGSFVRVGGRSVVSPVFGKTLDEGLGESIKIISYITLFTSF